MYSHWPQDKILPERQSRHFFDLYKLLKSNVGKSATNNPSLLKRVAEHKKIYFRSGWANYGNAIQGSLRLIPSENVLAKLENDYKKMQEMFYGTPIDWNVITDTLQKFSAEFNQGQDTRTIVFKK